ncbi:MAG: formylglycine-generating enzyme family protein [Planctomycetota bacterium]|nr:formylglycine-generating enzyme family protein [Planctomycetota bacterium]
MSSVIHRAHARQALTHLIVRSGLAICATFSLALFGAKLFAAEDVKPVPNSTAKTATEMKPYTEEINNTTITFEMVPIPGGKFLMGSPESEEGRKPIEGPQQEVTIAPFWMGKHEVTWDEYEVYLFAIDCKRRKVNEIEPSKQDLAADALIRPTSPYTDMTFGMGKSGFPAISMTQYAARMYCQWLSIKTGHYYRLPTEAEWEYACRAGTKTAYSFGDDPEKLGEYAVYYNDGETEKYAKIGTKKPNPWGLHDMHGNVTEWCLDVFDRAQYAKLTGKDAVNPVALPTKLYPNVVRGGAWDDEPDALRSAARRASNPDWKQQDPQIPQSVWYHTDAQFSGFRIVRPLVEPTEEEKKAIWDVGLDIGGRGGRVTHPCQD